MATLCPPASHIGPFDSTHQEMILRIIINASQQGGTDSRTLHGTNPYFRHLDHIEKS
jgi:hypothetical protein